MRAASSTRNHKIVDFVSGQAANDINSGIQWAGDKIKNAANSVSNWFNKTFGGGSSPGDPNGWKNGQSAKDVINKAQHVFGQSKHNLDGLLKEFSGDQIKGYKALTDAAQNYVSENGIMSGTLNPFVIKVKGYSVTVEVYVTEGLARIRTAYIP